MRSEEIELAIEHLYHSAMTATCMEDMNDDLAGDLGLGEVEMSEFDS